MMSMRIVRRELMRALGAVAAAAFVISTAPPAQALTPIGAGGSPSARQAPEALPKQVRFGGHGGGHHGGGGGFRGGGFHGGGFRGGAPAFHRGGGGFRAAAPAFHGGGFRHGPAFHGGGARYAAPFIARRHAYAPASYYGYRRHHFRPRYYGYAPVYYGPRYYHPRRFCRIVMTYYGPRKICRYRPWVHHHWRHHHRRFQVYW